MAAGTDQTENQCLLQNLIHKKPVRFNVTLPHILIIPGIRQCVVTIFLRQWLFIDKQGDDCLQLFLIETPFYGNLIVFFELYGELVRS